MQPPACLAPLSCPVQTRQRKRSVGARTLPPPLLTSQMKHHTLSSVSLGLTATSLHGGQWGGTRLQARATIWALACAGSPPGRPPLPGLDNQNNKNNSTSSGRGLTLLS